MYFGIWAFCMQNQNDRQIYGQIAYTIDHKSKLHRSIVVSRCACTTMCQLYASKIQLKMLYCISYGTSVYNVHRNETRNYIKRIKIGPHAHNTHSERARERKRKPIYRFFLARSIYEQDQFGVLVDEFSAEMCKNCIKWKISNQM